LDTAAPEVVALAPPAEVGDVLDGCRDDPHAPNANPQRTKPMAAA
jgi:hypothetical protein